MRANYQNRSVSLSRLLGRITELFEEQITPHEVWVRAEVSSYTKRSNGHHYFDLVEQRDQVQIARCRAVIWRGNADAMKVRNGMDISTHLEDGREILCLARAVYHPVFGLSLQISEVDPNFALGEVEKRRRESIARLKKEGLLELNRCLPLPIVIQKIALIAAEGSAGLADITSQLKSNRYGYQFEIQTFYATVQGKDSSSSILKAYQEVDTSNFDVIVLIRGGGASLDLDSFNEYQVNAALAQSPIPFIVGIGHETDRTVMDEWAAVSLKTPSAVGAWIVERAREFDIHISTIFQQVLETYRDVLENVKTRLVDRTQFVIRLAREMHHEERIYLNDRSRQIARNAERKLQFQGEFLKLAAEHMNNDSGKVLANFKHELSASTVALDRFARELFIVKKHQLSMSAELVELYHPTGTLKRGYALLRKNGSIQTSSKNLRTGDEIEIQLTDALISSEIKNIKQHG